MSLASILRASATLLLAFGTALLCVRLRTPLPWMIGPLLATTLASIAGAPMRSWSPLRNLAQAVIGTSLGLYFTPGVAALVGSLWWAMLLTIAWSLAVGSGFGAWLLRMQGHRMGVGPREQRATCFFAGAVGGASEMTLLAERENGRSDLVAAAHSVRIMIVSLLIPFAVTAIGVHGADATLPGPRTVQPLGLLALAAASAAGCWLMLKSGRGNPWFLGALLPAMGLTLLGLELSAMPTWLSNGAQLVIGVSLGVRFQREFMRAAPVWLGAVALGTVVMVLACAGFAVGLGWITGLHFGTLILGTAPGGIAEMAITAKVLQLGVPVVTAFQVVRLVAVLLLLEPLYRWWARAADGPPAG